MALRLNENKEIVDHVKRDLKEKDGYCACRVRKLPILKAIAIVCSTINQRINLGGYYVCIEVQKQGV